MYVKFTLLDDVSKFLDHAGQNKQRSSDFVASRLDEDAGDYHVKKVPQSKGRAIAQARQRKGWTQKELATVLTSNPFPTQLQQIQEQISIVQTYENGKAIPNEKILAKMRKALGSGQGF